MKKGTSSKPLRYGIIGLITALPNALFTLLSSTFILEMSDTVMSDDLKTEQSLFYFKLVLWSAVIGFLFSLISKRFYRIAGFVMLLCGLLILISIVTANVFLIFPAIFFIIGGTYCFTQEKINTKQ
ncbi:hypothetical protein [Tenacibaculum maritimum]|uniref:hypothetical protein n=1 Tax=Tenacibaculum maritimum TaxID=107401 RepID=UPI001764D710|nr:MAG: hypothetical protein GKR88_10090 [Flavobacteriaceae bacterium]